MNSYATGSVSAWRDNAGGLVGFNSDTITNSYAIGSVSALRNAGGLVGWNTNTITNSYVTGSVSALRNAGGLVGWNTNTITNSYAIGSVSALRNAGGLVGWNTNTITNSYVTGSVSGGTNVGGLIGNNTSGIITSSYWDINTSGITTEDDGKGKTTLELQSPTAPGSTSAEIYYDWDPNVWDFGTPTQYPTIIRHAAVPPDALGYPMIICAAFYPHIGQTELFFRVDGIAVNQNGFTIAGHTIESVERIGGTADTVSALKITLDREIVADSILVSYKPTSETLDNEAIRTFCGADLDTDYDDDNIIDVVDINPFDGNDSFINTNVASSMPIAEAPTTSSVFYSRSTVIRSLLRNEEFIYIDENEQGEFVRQTFIGMTPAAYFGIDAKVFRDDIRCTSTVGRILGISEEYHLNRVRIDQYCTDISDSFGDEPAGERPYLWATVDNNGYLTSRFLNFSVEVLPEINFSGQASYLYINSPFTSQTVVISTHTIDSSLSQVQVQRGRIGSGNSTSLTVGLTNNELVSVASIVEGKYTIANLEYPQQGETITHWLDTAVVDREGEAMAWHPADGLATTSGGVIKTTDDNGSNSNYRYAIGPNNNIDVRLAASDQDITRIRQVRLYEVGNPEATATQTFLVSSVVVGRSYYVIADFEASTDAVTIEVSPMVEGYTITETTSTGIEAIRSIGGVVSDAIIPFTMNDFTELKVTVGWDRIGSAENVIETYLVTTNPPINYGEPDTNGNNIPDNADLNLNNNRLQIGTGANNSVDYLSTHGDQPAFLTYEALVIANDSNNTIMADNPSRYSSADIDYSSLSPEVREILGFGEAGRAFEGEDIPIERLAAFGVREVDYAIGDNNEVTGGITHMVFPISSDFEDRILYIGKYNRSEKRWKSFERGTLESSDGIRYSDTWYGIPRSNTNEPCPTNIEVYKNRHQAAGEEGQGFMASDQNQNCIMLVITDGGPYDSSGLDGRVVDDTVATANKPLVQASQDSIGGGGGAIDIGGVILLLVALSSVAITTRRVRKNTTKANQK